MNGQAPLIDENDPVQSVFTPVLGLPAWSVQKGQGSILTFDFGDPTLRIREPIEPQSTTPPRVAAQLRRRNIRPIGEWHLWIYCCNWRCIEGGSEIAHSESTEKRINSVARVLNGQRLMSVGIDPVDGTSSFSFDLGAVLQTWPYEDEDLDEQWSLHRRSGYTFAYRKDGRYSWSAPDVRSGEEIWLPLPAPKSA